MNTFLLNKDRIEFTDNRFYQAPNGDYVPSVTTILEAYPKDASYFKWLKDVGSDADTIRDEAGKRGSIVHELTERYDSGEEVSLLNEFGKPRFKMLEWAMFERYIDFSERYKSEILMMESHFVSSKLGFAGTLDRVIEFKGEILLVDIKTSNSIYPSYWLQLSAYKELLSENKVEVDRVAILWLNAKTRTLGKNDMVQGIGWQMVFRSEKETKTDYKNFKATHQLWKSLNEEIKPRNISYQIKHKKV